MPTVRPPWTFRADDGEELLCDAPDWSADNRAWYRASGQPVTAAQARRAAGVTEVRTGPDEALLTVWARERPGPVPDGPIVPPSLTASAPVIETWFPCRLTDPDGHRSKGMALVQGFDSRGTWAVRFVAGWPGEEPST